MFKLLRMSLLALPLMGGVALAQNNTGTPLPAPQTGTTDTRTPTQKRAGYIDDGTLPGDATRPTTVPQTAPMSDTSALPKTKMKRHKTTTSSTSTTDTVEPMSTPSSGTMHEGADKSGDLTHDQQNSDK